MSTNKTFNQILGTFHQAATAHPGINSFATGEAWDINNKTDILYPLMYAIPAESTTAKNKLLLKFHLIFADLVNQDDSTSKDDLTNEVLSDQLQTALDVRAWLKENPCNGFTLLETSTLDPFRDEEDDVLAGWRLTVDAEIYNLDALCNIPGLYPCNSSNDIINVSLPPLDPCSYFYCLTSTTIYTTILSATTIYSGDTNIENIIYNIVSANTQATNIGSGTGEVYKNKLGNLLRFRTLSAGTFISSITTEAQTVTINAAAQPDQFWEYGTAGVQSIQRKYSSHFNNSNYSIAVGQYSRIISSAYSLAGGKGAYMSTSPYSTILGKQNAMVGSSQGSILGGFYNSIQGSTYSTVVAGRVNRISGGTRSVIVQGGTNRVYGSYCFVGNGKNHIAYSNQSFIGNGDANIVHTLALFGTIVNGGNNEVHNTYSTILNGLQNKGYSKHNLIGGGNGNRIYNYDATYHANFGTILNGRNNKIDIDHSGRNSEYSQILNGFTNLISNSKFATILNGKYNIISDASHYATILNGQFNKNYSVSSIVAGQYNIDLNGARNAILGGENNSSLQAINCSILSSKYSIMQSANTNCTIIGGNDSVILTGLSYVTMIGLQNYTAYTSSTTYMYSAVVDNLSGIGLRMVVADDFGRLGVAVIPSGGSSGSSTTTSYKANTVANSSFAGTPLKYTVTFPVAFSAANYSIQITGQDERDWTYESKAAGSFVINSHSNVALTGDTDWLCIAYN